MSGTVDTPVFQHFASARVAQDRPGIGMSSGHLPAMNFLLCGHRHRLLENLTAVVWMHGRVAITMKDNGRDRLSGHPRLSCDRAGHLVS